MINFLVREGWNANGNSQILGLLIDGINNLFFQCWNALESRNVNSLCIALFIKNPERKYSILVWPQNVVMNWWNSSNSSHQIKKWFLTWSDLGFNFFSFDFSASYVYASNFDCWRIWTWCIPPVDWVHSHRMCHSSASYSSWYVQQLPTIM